MPNMRFPPTDTSPTSVGPSLLNSPKASITPGPPSIASLVSSGPSSELILSTDVAQVILQDQRSIVEMRFMLLARLSDGISLPHPQVQTPGSLALMPENRLHFILLFSLDHHGRWWLFLPFKLLGPLKRFQATDMEDRMDPPSWGKVQSISH